MKVKLHGNLKECIGNKIQHNFNAEIQDSLISKNWAIDEGKIDYAKDSRSKCQIKERNI